MRPLFVSHGAPTLPFDDVPARDFLAGLGTTMKRPRAILVISAHWETERPMVNSVRVNDTIHDFYGFPAPLYDLRYPAPGDPALALKVVERLAAAGIEAGIDPERGLDHGAWVPLLMAWPKADIPVVQLSVQPHLGAAHHLAVGQALQALADEDILILASGSATHNLGAFRTRTGDDEPDWVRSFADWLNLALIEGRTEDVIQYRQAGPNAVQNHPTEEHLLPLFVSLGAAGPQARAERLHSSQTFGILRMDAWAFESA